MVAVPLPSVYVFLVKHIIALPTVDVYLPSICWLLVKTLLSCQCIFWFCFRPASEPKVREDLLKPKIIFSKSLNFLIFVELANNFSKFPCS